MNSFSEKANFIWSVADLIRDTERVPLNENVLAYFAREAEPHVPGAWIDGGTRDHDVTRTLNEWIVRDASDETQLLESTARGRIIFTFNVRDSIALAQRYPRHGGIILAAQASWTLFSLIAALDRLLSRAQADDWTGQVRWLNQWRVTE